MPDPIWDAYKQGRKPDPVQQQSQPEPVQPEPISPVSADPWEAYKRGEKPGSTTPQPSARPWNYSYWEDPVNVARAYMELESLPPGSDPPEWIADPDRVRDAYEYFSYRSNGAPWYEWDFLPEGDPGRELLRGMTSPQAAGFNQVDGGWQRAPVPVPEPQPSLDIAGMTDEEFDALPLGQKVMLSIIGGGGKAAGGVMGGVAGLVSGGVGGAIGGTLVGTGLGGVAEKAPGLAKWLMYLDYPAEWIERGIGALGLLTSGTIGLDEFLRNHRNVLRAAHYTYEVAQFHDLFREKTSSFNVWGLDEYGRPVQRTLRPEQANEGALLEIYQRLQAGESLESIDRDIRMRFGLGAEFREQAGHLILDPLNFIGLIAARGLGKAGKVAGNLPLEQAARGSAGVIETLQTYGQYLRQGMFNAPAPTAMTGFQRYLAGVDAAGQLKILKQPAEMKGVKGTLNKLGGAVVAGGPMAGIGFGIGGPVGAVIGGGIGAHLGFKQGLGYLFNLTPAARATEVVNMAGVNSGLLLERLDNADDMVRAIKTVGQSNMEAARAYSMAWLESPEGAALPLMFRDFGDKADALLGVWKQTTWKRQTLENIASVTGRSVDDILRELDDVRDADLLVRQYVEKARAVGGDVAAEILRAYEAKELTGKSLQGIFKTFVTDKAPHNLDLFKGQLLAAMEDHSARWAAKWFNVQPDPTWIRLGKTVKSAQSLLLLGLNPTYFVNNAINNMVVMAAGGVLGFRKGADIDAIWNRIGVSPAKLKQGIGPGGDVARLEAIKAAQEAPGMLSDLTRLFGRASNKLGVMTKASGKVEAWGSANAMTTAFLQQWHRLWQPGQGFNRMPRQLEQVLTAVDPNLPGLVYDAIRSGMNKDEIEAALWSGVTRKSMDSLVPEVAREMGIEETHARQVLQDSVDQAFLDAVQTAGDDDKKLSKAFSDLYNRTQQKLDDLHREAVTYEAEHARSQVAAEGAQAAFQQIIDAAYDFVEHQFSHWTRMEETARQADEIRVMGGDGSGVWRPALAFEQKSYKRLNERIQARYLGVINALGVDSPHSRNISDGLIEHQKTWEDFYAFRDAEWSRARGEEITWEEARANISARYQQAFDAQEAAMDRVSAALVELFTGQYGEQMRDPALQTFARLKEIRTKLFDDMRRFRDEGAESWAEFLRRDNIPTYQSLYTSVAEGMRNLVRIATGREAPPAREVPAAPELHDMDWQLGGSSLAEGRAAQTPPTLARMSIEHMREEGWTRGIQGLLYAVNKDRREAGLPPYKTADQVPFEEAAASMRKRLTPEQGAAEQVEFIQQAVDEYAQAVDDAAAGRAAEPEPARTVSTETIETGAQVPEAPTPADPPAVNAALGTVERVASTPPVARMAEEAWNASAWPILRRLQAKMMGAKAPTSLKAAALDAPTLAMLRDYVAGVYGQMSDVKLASIRVAEMKRDMALLPYGRRYGMDMLAQTIMPYHFFYTRAGFTWALRSFDKPAWLSTYARLRNGQERYTSGPGFPSRLKRKMRVNIPFLPDWMGPVFADPMRQMFPFEQLYQPLEMLEEQNSQLERQAAYVIDGWLDDGEITDAEAQSALQQRAGPVWEKAVSQAQMEIEENIANPADFAALMFGFSLPLEWIRRIYAGKPEKITQLPVTRLIQSATALAGVPGGVNIEAPIRRALGLPEMGEWGEYYLARELAAMAADGTVSPEEAELAMVERSGEAWELAMERVGKTLALRNIGGALRADIFPEGEEKFRTLNQQYRALIESGASSKELAQFYDDHPEFQAYKLMNKSDDPAAMLKGHLLNTLWDRWWSLPDLARKELREAFGDTWETFENKETRSIDAVDTPTLAFWVQAMGAKLPSTVPQLPAGMMPELPGQEMMAAYQQYVDEREQHFPGIFDIQSAYYDTPEGQRGPMPAELQAYNAWRYQQLASNPQLIPYASSQEPQTWEGGTLPLAGAPLEIQQLVYAYRAQREQHFPGIFDVQDAYYSLDKQARRRYLKEHPELPAYWDWMRAFQGQYPQILPYVKSIESIAEGVLGESYQAPEQIVPVDPADFHPALIDSLARYYFSGGSLGEGARRELRRLWESYGRPGDDLQSWIDGQLRAQMSN
jgi:hypothetical protein